VKRPAVVLQARAAGCNTCGWLCADIRLLQLFVVAGVRKEFDVEGRQVLMFWYRNNIYAIEARSPAEGAYSEGFIKAKFTQVRCCTCLNNCSRVG
jgi:hypothetical protein